MLIYFLYYPFGSILGKGVLDEDKTRFCSAAPAWLLSNVVHASASFCKTTGSLSAIWCPFSSDSAGRHYVLPQYGLGAHRTHRTISDLERLKNSRFDRENDMNTKNMRVLVLAIWCVVVLSLTGCERQPYNVPEFVDIAPNETAFMIPMSGDTTNQKQWQSEEFLAQKQVSSKRVEIPHEWVQTGRGTGEGKWVPTVQLLKVSLSPETREWTEGDTTGTSAKNQGIKAETKESTSFMARMNCSCQISEGKSATFLHWYYGRQLAEVMDNDVRALVEKHFVAECAHYTLEDLLTHKDVIMHTVEIKLREYCEARGITLNYVGLKGDLTYDNHIIQEALDNRFKARQERLAQSDIDAKNIGKARADAQSAQIMSSIKGQQYTDFTIRKMALENQAKLIAVLGEKGVPTTVGVNTIIGQVFAPVK